MASRRTRRAAKAKRIVTNCLLAASLILMWNVFFSTTSQKVPLEQQKPALGICVTGQLCRLELKNKMERFILPSAKVYDTHVHFELDDGTCKYTNYAGTEAEEKGLYHVNSFSELGSYLMEYQDVPLSHKTKVDHQASSSRRTLSVSFGNTSIGEPVIQYRYMYTLNKLGQVNETLRAMNHWRQWKSYQKCMHSLDTVRNFDLYVRLREDLLFYHTYVPPLVWLHQTEHDLWLPRCASWQGFNDKIAFIHPRARQEYFMQVLEMYERHYDDLRCSPNHSSCRYLYVTNNPESFLMQALTNLKVRVQRLDPENFPAFTGQHLHGDYFCFHQYRRQLGHDLDCLPATVRKRFKPPCHDFALLQ